MEKWEQFSESADSCFEALRSLLDQSFQLMDLDKAQKEKMIALWRKQILGLVDTACKLSEKYNNQDVMKAITRALMFGK